jgi:hypothetical protein
MPSSEDVLKNATSNALKMMKESGFEISNKLEVSVDDQLPFMGYSTERKGGHVIVISAAALKSGMIEGLLIHEMCHIYRTETNHPSHNHKLLDRVGLHVIHENHLTEEYQIRIIQQAVNHIQDLYADDIAFKVFEKDKLFPSDQALDFFLSWIQDTPVNARTNKAKWMNVGSMLNNCFAISDLTRHHINDVDNKAKSAIQEFLSQTEESMRKEFAYFRSFMANLKENPAQEEFEKDLADYLSRIVKLAT